MKLTDVQRTALTLSIEHWRRMRDDPDCGEKPYSGDCDCCRLWLKRKPELTCKGCPIAEATGDHSCINTPWGAAEYAYWLWGEQGREVEWRMWQAQASRMIKCMEKILNESEES